MMEHIINAAGKKTLQDLVFVSRNKSSMDDAALQAVPPHH
jgi:hypothetical protein